ncbi:hypothetical protein GGG16DRAFT_23478, partial [Schizophyllum commune]
NSQDSSAKGKGPDIRNFGNLQFTEDEQDPEIQRQIWESARHQNTHTKPINEATTSRNMRSPSREGSAMRLAALQDEVHRKTMELADYSITSAKLSKQLDDLTRKYDDLLEIMSDRSHTQVTREQANEVEPARASPAVKFERTSTEIPVSRTQRISNTPIRREDRTRPSCQGDDGNYWKTYMDSIIRRIKGSADPDDPDGSSSDSSAESSKIRPVPPEKYNGKEDDEAFWRFVIESFQYVIDGHVPWTRQVDMVSRYLTDKARVFYTQNVM